MAGDWGWGCRRTHAAAERRLLHDGAGVQVRAGKQCITVQNAESNKGVPAYKSIRKYIRVGVVIIEGKQHH